MGCVAVAVANGATGVAALRQGAAGHVAIVKFERAVGEDLIIFVTFSCEEYDVPGACFVHGETDGLFAVGLDHVFAGGFLHADDDVADNFQRIFATGIVVRKNGEVAEAARDFAHDRALGTVFAPAAAEEGDGAALGIQFAGGADETFESVIGVSVIDDNEKGLAEIDALEAAWDAFEIADAGFDDVIGKAESLGRADGSEQIVDVDAADEWRSDLQLSVGSLRGERKALKRELEFAGGDVSGGIKAVADSFFGEASKLSAVFVVDIKDGGIGNARAGPSEEIFFAAK